MGGMIAANADLSIPPTAHTPPPTLTQPPFLLITSFFKCKAARESELISPLLLKGGKERREWGKEHLGEHKEEKKPKKRMKWLSLFARPLKLERDARKNESGKEEREARGDRVNKTASKGELNAKRKETPLAPSPT